MDRFVQDGKGGQFHKFGPEGVEYGTKDRLGVSFADGVIKEITSVGLSKKRAVAGIFIGILWNFAVV